MSEVLVEKSNRKFRDISFYDTRPTSDYFLMPFRFHRLNEYKEVMVNEVGDHLIVPIGTTERVINRKINKYEDAELYGDLISNFFVSEPLFHL